MWTPCILSIIKIPIKLLVAFTAQKITGSCDVLYMQGKLNNNCSIVVISAVELLNPLMYSWEISKTFKSYSQFQIDESVHI